jgi:hypothetical protein
VGEEMGVVYVARRAGGRRIVATTVVGSGVALWY